MSDTPQLPAGAPDSIPPRTPGAGYLADDTVLRAALDVLLRNWRWTLGFVVLGGLLALAGSFLVTPMYRSEVRVSVVLDLDRAGGAALGGALGGLASLAGLQTQGSAERAESLAVLASRSLGERFLVAEDLMPGLFPDRWDAVAKSWIPRGDKQAPTIREAFTAFTRDIRVIQEDSQSGLIVVAMNWSDPVRAAQLANGYVDLANSTLRARAIEEARASLQFLDAELGKTQSIPVRESIFRLVETQTKKIMLANVRRDYAFKVIDPAVPPDEGDVARPRRLLMAAVGALLGLTLGILAGVLRSGRRAPHDRPH